MTILGGVTVGIGAVVGAGSVLAQDAAPFTVVVGNPGRPVRRICDDAVLHQHLQELGYSVDFARQVVERRREALAGSDLPVLDHTARYEHVPYTAPPGSGLSRPGPVGGDHV